LPHPAFSSLNKKNAMHYLIVPVDSPLVYERHFYNNRHLNGEQANFRLLALGRAAYPAADIPGRCSLFAANPPQDMDGWLIFCSEYYEFYENPFPRLERTDPSCLYGLLGRRRIAALRGKSCYEYIGRLEADAEEEPDPHWRSYRLLGIECPDGEEVEAVTGPCLALHSDLVRENAWPAFACRPGIAPFEDLCMVLRQEYSASCRIIRLPGRLHGEAVILPETDARAHAAGEEEPEPVLYEELVTEPEDVIYRTYVHAENANTPAVIAAALMERNGRILDVGCAYGDNGVFFKKTLDAALWGMERSPAAIRHARKTQAYQEVTEVDLEDLHLTDFSRFYRFFSHIFLGDVLEHLRAPWSVLPKLRELLAPKGSMLVSLPNVRHCLVSAALLAGAFDYASTGILDRTHLRFFTASGQAKLFARAGLEVEDAVACFAAPEASFPARDMLPWDCYEYMLADRHFFAVQYLSRLTPSRLPASDLERRNAEKLRQAVFRNDRGWSQTEKKLDHLRLRLTLAMGGAHPPPLRERLRGLFAAGNKVEAILESLMFDPRWYAERYPETRAAGNPLLHYITTGWKEGKNPGPYFDTARYLSLNPQLRIRDQCPLLHYMMHFDDHCRREPAPSWRQRHAAEYVRSLHERCAQDFVPEAELRQEARGRETEQKVGCIAFYLPQFYPIPLNDGFWERGFTEWTNVTRALPLYAGHHQPHLPVDLGFYDLRLTETVTRQIQLAKKGGIAGFCYYWYWFDGVKMLDMPMGRLLEHPELDFPFCVAWANEPWIALWDGGSRKILIDQPKSVNAEKLFADLLPLFADPRYIRVDGKPLFIVYRAEFHQAEVFRRAMERLRELALRSGFPGMQICLIRRGNVSLAEFGGDAFVEFPPQSVQREPSSPPSFIDSRYSHAQVFDMREIVRRYMRQAPPRELTYRGVMPSWDNSPRKAETGCHIFAHSSPALYEDWLRFCIERVREENPEGHRFVFINAWNEWGEGAHLEPDRRYGYAWLAATRRALSSCGS
jgi:2-polyprenyl-3-methyl-5-hydroxy-6-metoxy-1,4-benzoquinol methylase